MIRARDWPPIERLPEGPGIIKMTGTGYAIDGKHFRTVGRNADQKPFFSRIMGLVGRGR